MRTHRITLLALGLASASLTCRGADLAPPEAATLVRVAGDGQSGLINQALTDSLVVRVEDAQGQPLAGVAVEWTVGGGGTVSSAHVTTGGDGRAAVQRILGGTAGQQTTIALVAELPSVMFTSTAEVGSVPHLVITTQPSGAAASAVPFAQQPVVEALDATGQPLGAGIAVTASVEGATLAGTTALESDGTGTIRFTDLALTGPEGTYRLTFSAPDFAPVQSGAIVLASTPSGDGRVIIQTQPSNVAENGQPLSQQPVVRVEDRNGQPLGAGVAVTASVEGATLSGTTAVASDASGVVRFSDLALSGPDGSYSLTFSSPGLTQAQSNPITIATVSQEGGHWTAPFSWPIVPIHTVLLPDGRVLAIGRTGTPQVWDPATGAFTTVPPPAWLFCAGHALLADGRVLVAGGHIKDHHGIRDITLFSAATSTWTSSAPMAHGRWYPTTTVMGNGDVVITAGRDEDSVAVTIPEVWSNGSVHQLTGAAKELPYYPRAFLTPNGSVYVAGPARNTHFLSVAGSGAWTSGPQRSQARDYGSAVMYDDGKILYAGGGRTTNTAEVIDLNQASPTWRSVSSMAFARRHHNLTVLPTGEVLATGGVAGTGFNDIDLGVHAAEMWNPTTERWTTLSSNAVTRGYHGTSVLLPDGRVLNAGSGEGAGAPDQRNGEIFSPPYLFRGARPEITSAPPEVRYGEQFRVLTPQAGGIAKVSLIRLGAATHAFDQNQRFQRLSFTADATGLTVTAPSSSNRTPPGHYMLFILNGSDVPSVAKIIRIF